MTPVTCPMLISVNLGSYAELKMKPQYARILTSVTKPEPHTSSCALNEQSLFFLSFFQFSCPKMRLQTGDASAVLYIANAICA